MERAGPHVSSVTISTVAVFSGRKFIASANSLVVASRAHGLRLERQLTDNPSALAHSNVGGGKLITARTDEVQAFVLAHKGEFTNEFKLVREAKPKK